MNPIQKAMTWFQIVSKGMMAGDKIRESRQGKHYAGSKPSPKAKKLRRLLRKRERQARTDHHRRMKA